MMKRSERSLRKKQDDKKLVIVVDEDCEITTPDDDAWLLNDTGHEEVFRWIFVMDVCAELKVREVRTLARLLAINRHTPVPVEFVFKNSPLEIPFRVLTIED